MSSAEQHPYFTFENPEYNFEKFHIVIAICTVIGAILFILNIALGCCSRYSEYWNDIHTGNFLFAEKQNRNIFMQLFCVQAIAG